MAAKKFSASCVTMKLFYWIIILLNIFNGIFADTGADLSRPSDYDQLVEYANIVLFAYCVKHGLKAGNLISQRQVCKTSRCTDKKYLNIEFISTFNFNSLGDVGTGFYAIDHKAQRIILAFRGSSSRRDWIANIDTIPITYDPLINLVLGETKVDCPGCKVHKGFYNFLRKNAVDIMTQVKHLKEKNPDYQLLVLGHSLGASFALLSGIEFQLMKLDPLVVTYASPKVGNKRMMEFVDELFDTAQVSEFATNFQTFNKGYIRVVHQGDLVPFLPPTDVFVHGGFEYYIDKSELPHKPENLKRKGIKSMGSSESEAFEAYSNPLKLIPEFSGRNSHSNYFIKITGCS